MISRQVKEKIKQLGLTAMLYKPLPSG